MHDPIPVFTCYQRPRSGWVNVYHERFFGHTYGPSHHSRAEAIRCAGNGFPIYRLRIILKEPALRAKEQTK